jgi:G6PDH family F420-dependent oxidoreductase
MARFRHARRGKSRGMMRIGYTMMTEQAGPRELVGHVVEAERVGFDFSVISDHSFPWLEEQGHAPYAWSVLGAAAQATSRIPLMTFVTCPTFRYHPVVVAQKAATLQLLSEGRFRLGLGSGENLNEHVVGEGWPSARVRLDMLDEAAEIIHALFKGEYVTRHGRHYQVDDARLWDVPDTPPPVGIAASGPRSCALAGRHGDLLIATEPKRELVDAFDAQGGAGKPRIGQLPLCYDTDREAAVARAHEQFRWSVGGWRLNAELPLPASFAQATEYVRPEDVAKSVPCGDDVDAVVEAVRPYAEAGFTDLALVQVGGAHQMSFLRWAETKLLPALRAM